MKKSIFNNLSYWLPVIYLSICIINPAEAADIDKADHYYRASLFFTISADTADTLNGSKPRFDDRRDERNELVRLLGNRVQNAQVLQAMRQVPRHLFVPEKLRNFAYQNRPLPIGYEQTISQPFIVAYMTQLLDLQSGEKVLEIGTGSGYQAAVLSEITPHVYTIEIVSELGKQARALFDSLGYSTIKTKIGDGYRGWQNYAPFDAVILTAAPPEIPQPLIDQLKPGGVLVAPVGETGRTQVLTKITKMANGEIKRETKLPVRFVPMTGDAQQDKH